MLLLQRESHMQLVCLEKWEDFKKLRVMKTNDDKFKANVVQNFEDEDMYLASAEEVAKSKWVMDYAIFKHICRV